MINILEKDNTLRTYANTQNCEKALVRLGFDVADLLLVGLQLKKK